MSRKSVKGEGRERFEDLRGSFVEPWKDFEKENWDRGGSFPYGHADLAAKDGSWFMPDLTSGSDYSGSLVEKSNYKGLHEEADRLEPKKGAQFHVELYGGHGTYALAFHVERTPDEIVEALQALEDYPLLDEEAHSEMEMEAQDEAWEDWARSAYKRALEKKFDGDADDVTEEELQRHFEEARDAANEYWVNESGDSMYIDLERIVKKVKEPPEGFKENE